MGLRLITHCLYGIDVYTPHRMMTAAYPLSARAPGEHQPIRLLPAHPALEQQSYSTQVPMTQTHGRDMLLLTDRALAFSQKGQQWCLHINGVLRFYWTGGENTLYFQFIDRHGLALLPFWFVHIVMPIYLTLERSHNYFHAAAIGVGAMQQPVVLIAPSQGGKSTLTDHFVQRGHALFADDKLAAYYHGGDTWTAPSHPFHRPWREDEVLGHTAASIAQCAQPITAIYVLEAGPTDCDIAITKLSGIQAFTQLQPHFLFSFQHLLALRLHRLSQLLDSTPVYHLRRPWTLDKMEDVYQAICNHAPSTPSSHG